MKCLPVPGHTLAEISLLEKEFNMSLSMSLKDIRTRGVPTPYVDLAGGHASLYVPHPQRLQHSIAVLTNTKPKKLGGKHRHQKKVVVPKGAIETRKPHVEKGVSFVT